MVTVKKSANVNAQKQAGEMKDYFKGVVGELKKVHWPDRQQLLTYTGVVFVAVAIVSVLLWIVDNGLSFVMTKLLG